MLDIFGPVISSYTREQAIEDGVIIDLMVDDARGMKGLVLSAGFKFPLAMTSAAFESTVCGDGEFLPEGQDTTGRLWDVLWLLKLAIKNYPGGTDLRFAVMVNRGAKRNGRAKMERVELKSTCGPGDNMEPVITIMLADED